MYEELVKRLNAYSAEHQKHGGITAEAADAIEELEKLTDAQLDIIKQYQVYLTKQHWISVTERLPKGADESGEICENVWLLFDDGCVYPGWMNGTTKKVYFLDDMNDVVMRAPISRVRAWQPGPKSPKENESEDEDDV